MIPGFQRFSVSNFQKVTPKLAFYLLFMSLGSIMFGYDTGMFGGVQQIPAFIHQFGDTVDKTGKQAISAKLISMMSSFAFIGKFFGTVVVGPIIERFGHRRAMYVFCIASYIGAILEATAKVPAQFIIGRITMYFAVGFTENVVPTYQSELALMLPLLAAAARGAFVGSIQFFIAAGGFISAGINKKLSLGTTPHDWLVPVSIQVVLPFIIMCGLPFLPDSPRWLLSKGRREEAVNVLERCRPRADAEAGLCREEIGAIEEALSRDMEKRPWADLFRGTNLRRTSIASIVFFAAQFTGQAFISQYGPRFYSTVGFASQAFTFSLINSAVGLVACFIGLFLIDFLGRRNILLFGAVSMALFLFLVAGLGGSITTGTQNLSAGRAMIACTILFTCCFNVTWAPVPYIIGSEIGTGPLREKTMAFSSSLNVVSAFIVSFTLPYLLNALYFISTESDNAVRPYAALGARVGWVYGSFCLAAGVYTFFFVPETKGFSLEELDELFNDHISVFGFQKYLTTGAAARTREIESVIISRGTEKVPNIELDTAEKV